MATPLSVRLSDDERAVLDRRAAEAGLKPSSYIKRWIRRDGGLDQDHGAVIAELRARLERLEGMAGL